MAPDPDHSATAGGAGGGDLMERAVDGAIRLGRAWKGLTRERRMAAVAAAILWLTLFLPWYQASVVSRNPKTRNAIPVGESISGWAAFGLVQALILILSVGILIALFLRAEGRIKHLPGGDGWTVTAVGAFCVFLVILGLFNAPTPTAHGQYTVSTGLEWGIFLALIASAGLAWAGGRIRSSLEGDPFLAGNRREERSEQPDPAPVPERPHTPQPAPDPPATAATAIVPSDPPADPAEEPTRAPGIAEPLTAAAAQPAAQPAAHPTPVPADPRPAADTADKPDPPRSPWRPAERPDWTDPERPIGWLTARPKQPRSEDETE